MAASVLVTTGQDARSAVSPQMAPVVHAELQFSMDCPIKSGNDAHGMACPGRIADMRRAV
jgi:hypothetical protein